MVCLKCGAKVNTSDKICPDCGANLQLVSYEFDTSAFETLNVNNTLMSEVNETDNTIIKSKPRNVKVAVIVAVIVCTLFLAAIIVLKINSDKRHHEYIMSRTFTLNEDDFYIEVSGYDGYGELKVSVQEKKFMYAVMPALGYEEHDQTLTAIMDDILGKVDISLSKSSKLSNGQEIIAYISIDDKCLEKYDIYFEETTFKIVVNDLSEMKTVDIFEELYIDTNTAGDFVQVTWEYLGENSTYIERGITLNSTKLLNYGDNFILSLNTDVAEGLRSKYGINPLALEKEYVVLRCDDYEGWKYVNEFGNVSDIVIDRLTQKDIKTMKEFGEIKSMKCDDCEYVGGFVCNYEQYSTSRQSLILVYKLNNPNSTNSDDNVGYVWIEHFNLIENVYGIQRLKNEDVNEWSCDETDIKVCNSKDIKGVLDEIKERRNLEEERISYDPALKLYLGEEPIPEEPTTEEPTTEEPTSIPNDELTLMQRTVLGLEKFVIIRLLGESEITDIKTLDEEYYKNVQMEYCNKSFFVVDFDHDDNDEVLVYWLGKGIIFHEINGTIYGYEIGSRAMDYIYNDGVYEVSSGGCITWGCIQEFTITEMKFEVIAEKQYDYLTDAPEGYVIRYRAGSDSTDITEEEFNQIMRRLSNVEATRYDYTRENIEQFVVE